MIVLVMFSLLFSTAHADISLNDLGMSQDTQIKADPKFEKMMAERHSMLQTHEILGLTTWGLMTATLLTGGSALDSNAHMYLGMATGLAYFTTAYFSLSAPKPKGIKDQSRMKWHKALAWVTFPLMLLVPYLGYQYKTHEDNNQGHSSLEKQHATYAGILYGAFTIQASLMVIEF